MMISKIIKEDVDMLMAKLATAKNSSELGGMEEFRNQEIPMKLDDLTTLVADLMILGAANGVEDPKEMFTPEKIEVSADGRVTVVFWRDGDKTIVRLSEGDTLNAQNAFTNALAKKIFGSNSQIKKAIEDTTAVHKPKKKKQKSPTLPAMEAGGTLNAPAETMLSHIVTYEEPTSFF